MTGYPQSQHSKRFELSQKAAEFGDFSLPDHPPWASLIRIA
jgi:hypothetical protein